MVLTTAIFAIVVILGVLALGGTGMCTDGARLRDRRLAQWGVRRELTTRVAEVHDHTDAKLQGTAFADDGDGSPSDGAGELTAPFSGRRCVAYELTLFDYDGVRPSLLARVSVARSFLLRDDTGIAHVVPDPALVGIDPDKRWRFEEPSDARVVALLERHVAGDRWRHHPVVVCEGVIAVGGPVACYGHVLHEPVSSGADSPYRTLGSRALLVGSSSAPLLLIPDD
ncbi:MAG: hypothetical protein JWN44_2919 [Myxococcales bacterium]|nr:hypothetical protein [Myxococcales bacterium]